MSEQEQTEPRSRKYILYTLTKGGTFKGIKKVLWEHNRRPVSTEALELAAQQEELLDPKRLPTKDAKRFLANRARLDKIELIGFIEFPSGLAIDTTDPRFQDIISPDMPQEEKEKVSA